MAGLAEKLTDLDLIDQLKSAKLFLAGRAQLKAAKLAISS